MILLVNQLTFSVIFVVAFSLFVFFSQTVTYDKTMLWDHEEQGRFPQPKELKQMIWDKVAPSKDLGHSKTTSKQVKGFDTLDDEAENMRKYFGVL